MITLTVISVLHCSSSFVRSCIKQAIYSTPSETYLVVDSCFGKLPHLVKIGLHQLADSPALVSDMCVCDHHICEQMCNDILCVITQTDELGKC